MNKDKKPVISILMGVYNCETTVGDAILSILSQTYSEWEFIICDDGSSDKTRNIVDKYAEMDARIICISNNCNMGLAYTLNHCLSLARGKYIARMDGDDICTKNRLQIEKDFLDNNSKYDLVSCAMEFYDDKGKYGEYIYPKFPKKTDLIKNSPFCHAGCLIRKEVLTRLGGYSIDKRVERMEDYDLWFRFMAEGFYGYNIPEILYSMRDDRNAFKRRKLIYRFRSAQLKWRIWVYFKLSFKYLPYIVLPILKGILPERIYKYFHQKKLTSQNKEMRKLR